MQKITTTLLKWIVVGSLMMAPLFVFGGMPLSVATAQNVTAESLNAEIKRLRRDLRDLQQLMLQQSGNNDAVERIKSDVSGNVYEQMNTLDASMADMATRLEDIEGDSLEAKRKFEKLSKDLEFRLQQMSDKVTAVSETMAKGEKINTVSEDVQTLRQIINKQQELIKSQSEAIQRQTKALEDLNAKVQEAVTNSTTAMENSDKAITNSNQALANLEAVSKTTADVAKALKVKQTKAKAVAAKTEPKTEPKTKTEKAKTDGTKSTATAKTDKALDTAKKETPKQQPAQKVATKLPETKPVEGQSKDLKTKYDNSEAHYKKAVDLMSTDKLADAEVLFIEFIKQYPDDKSVDDAKYQYARLLVLRGQNASAGKLFTDIYENHPKSNRRPASLVELARLYEGAGNVNNACAILDVFNDQFASEKTTRTGKIATRLYKGYKCKKPS